MYQYQDLFTRYNLPSVNTIPANNPCFAVVENAKFIQYAKKLTVDLAQIG